MDGISISGSELPEVESQELVISGVVSSEACHKNFLAVDSYDEFGESVEPGHDVDAMDGCIMQADCLLKLVEEFRVRPDRILWE